MTWPDRVSVYHKLRSAPSLPCDFFGLDVIILSERHQRAAARCIEDLVVYNYRERTKTELSDFMVAQFQHTWRAQEAAKAINETRIKDLLIKVEKLEKASWDQEGAQEDLGGS